MSPRAVLAVLSLAGCTFTAQLPEEEELAPDGGPQAQPTNPGPARCDQPGLAMCVDFEGSAADQLGGSVNATNVQLMPRPPESAALFMIDSTLGVQSQKLDIAQTLTIEMWAKPARRPTNIERQFGLFDAHLQYALVFEDNGRIECSLFGSQGGDRVDSETSLTTDAWHHVACTYDGSTLKVYVDGKLEGCHPRSRTISTAGTSGAAIGATMDFGPTYRNRFLGELDNVHVFERTLTAQEICTAAGRTACSDDCPDD